MAKQDIFNAIDNAMANGQNITFNPANIPSDLTIEELASRIKQVSGKDVLAGINNAMSNGQKVSLPFNKLKGAVAQAPVTTPAQPEVSPRQFAENLAGQYGDSMRLVATVAAPMGLTAAKIPTFTRFLGQKLGMGVASAGLQGGIAGASTLASGEGQEEAVDDAKTMAMIDAGLSGAGAPVRAIAKASAPAIKRAIGGMTQAVTVGKVPYNAIRMWFKSGEEIDKVLKEGKGIAQQKVKRLADDMYRAVDAVDGLAEKSMKALQDKANRYQVLVGKAKGAVDKRLQKLAGGTVLQAPTIGNKALEMAAAKEATPELKNAYGDQVDKVVGWLADWNKKPNKTVADLIGAKQALDTELKNFYAAKSKGLDKGASDLVDSAFASIRGDINAALRDVADKAGAKSFAKVYDRASKY